MDVPGKLYIAWNSYLHHTSSCQYKESWLEVFLALVAKEWNERQGPVLPEIMGMCNNLCETLFRDISRFSETDPNYESEIQTYFLAKRGWKILATLLALDLKVLLGPQHLVEILLSVYELLSNCEQSSENVGKTLDFQWPLREIQNCWTDKSSPDTKEYLKDSSTDSDSVSQEKIKDFSKGFSSVSCHPVSCDDEENLVDAAAENQQEIRKITEKEDPNLLQEYEQSRISLPSFSELVLSLLEKITLSHGGVKDPESKTTISERVLKFSLDGIGKNLRQNAKRRLLRTILVANNVHSQIFPSEYNMALDCDLIPCILSSARENLETENVFPSEAVQGVALFLLEMTRQPSAVEIFESLQILLHQFCLSSNVELFLKAARVSPGILKILGSLSHHFIQVFLRRNHRLNCGKRRHKTCRLGRFHHMDSLGNALSDPEQLESQHCIVAFLYFLLLKVFKAADDDEDCATAALEGIATAGPCCCLPPSFVYSRIFSRLGNAELQTKALSLAFFRAGFSSGRGEQCANCRRNAGFELERYAEAGEYTADEALVVQTGRENLSLPWENLRCYTDAILRSLDDPLSVCLSRNVAFLVPYAATHVRMQIFNLVVLPITRASVDLIKKIPQDRNSNAALVFRTVWSLLPSFLLDKKICELFVLSDGIDYVLELCHVPVWAADAAAVLRALAVDQLRSREEQKGPWHLVEMKEIVPKEDPGPEKVFEATPLDLFEYLLSNHVVFVLKSLDCKEVKEILQDLTAVIDAHSSRQPIAKFIFSQQASIPEADLKTAVALWEAATQLAVVFPPFLNFLSEVSLVKVAETSLYAITREIVQQDQVSKLYFEILECFLTVSLMASRPNEESGLKLLELTQNLRGYHPPMKSLALIVLRTSTLEKWRKSPSHKLFKDSVFEGSSISKKDPYREDSGYTGDAEPCPMFIDPNKSNWPRLTQEVLCFPKICAQQVRILATWHHSCKDRSSDLDLYVKDVYSIVSRLYRICCLPLNAALLNRQKIIPVILQDLEPLVLAEDRDTRIPNLLLKTVSTMAEQHFTSNDLNLLIGLFKSEKPPIGELLPVFSDLIRGIAVQPSSILEFPQRRSLAKTDSAPKLEANLEIVKFSNGAKDFGQIHFEKGLGSAWKSAAIFIPVLADSHWSARSHGFTASFWFYIVPPDQTENTSADPDRPFEADQSEPGWLEASQEFDQSETKREKPKSKPQETELEPNPELHLISVGTKHSLMELWSDPQTGSLIVRITESTKSNSRCLATKTLGFKVKSGHWHHLVFSYSEVPVARLTAILDATETEDLILDIPATGIRQMNHSHLLLGTAVGPAEPCQSYWYMGNVTIFRGAPVSLESALYLYALGPDSLGLAATLESQPMPNFQKILKPDLIKKNINWNSIFEETILKNLQESLLLVYSTHSPSHVLLYPVVTSPAAGLLGSLFSGAQGAFSVVSSDHRPSQHAPMKVPVAKTTLPKPHVHTGIPTAVQQLGGYQLFCFLLARIVELEASEELQAMAFEILLSYLRSDPRQWNEFQANRGFSMLQHLFRNERCKIGKHFVKALVNASCSSVIVRYRPQPINDFRVSPRTSAVVCDPHLLIQGLKMWNIWQRRKDPTVLELLLEALRTLLRDGHPHRCFNVFQLRRRHVTETLLQIAKENLLYREGQPLSENHSMRIADLLSELLGSPPDMNVITAIMDHLLLTHPAACTYVISDWDNFFFLFTQPEGPKSAAFSGRTWAMPRIQGHEASAADCKLHIDVNKLNKALMNIEVKWQGSEARLPNGSPAGSTTPPGDATTSEGHSSGGKFSESNSFNSLGNLAETFQERDEPGDVKDRYNGHGEVMVHPGGERGDPEGAENVPGEEVQVLEQVNGHAPANPSAENPAEVPGFQDLVRKDPEGVPGLSQKLQNVPEVVGDVPKGTRERRRSKKKEIVEIGEWQVISHSVNQCNVSRSDCVLGSRLREKLLNLLTSCLQLVPDYMVEQLIGRVINPEHLLVMLNYPDEGVRAATIQLLNAVFLRSESEALKFIKQNGILLLASQMQHQPITFQIVEACLGICVGIKTSFEDMAEPLDLWPQDLNPLQLQGILLLIAALPDSVIDPPLLHNLVSLFRNLAKSSNTILRWMIDCGLLEAVGKTIIVLGYASPGGTDIFGQRGDELLIEGLQRLVLTIITRCLAVSGHYQWHVLQDFLLLLLYLERIEEISCGPDARSVQLLRETCCIITRQAMESMESLLRSRNDSGFHNGDDFPSGRDHFVGLSDKTLASCLPLGSTRKLHFDKMATKNEFCDRFRYIITKGTDIIVHLVPPESSFTDVELNFTKGFFLAVLQGFSFTLERSKSANHLISGDWSQFSAPDTEDCWGTLLWGCRDHLRSQLIRLLLHLLSPIQNTSLQCFVIKAVQQDPYHERVLRMLTSQSEPFRQELDSYLCRILLYSSPEDVDQGTYLRIQCLLKFLGPKLVNGAHKKFYQLPELSGIVQRQRDERVNWWKTMEDSQLKLLQRYDNVFKAALDSAMRMTRETVEAQNSLRKNFMEVLRGSYGDVTTVTNTWGKLIEDLTHEKAPWFFKDTLIQTWKLGTAEGPHRMRLRLERGKLDIDDKYFLPEARSLTVAEKRDPPLSFLLQRPVNERIERLVLRGKVRFSASCSLITVTEDARGELVLSETSLYFIAESASWLTNHLSWNFASIREIWKRRYEHQDRALELFTDEREVFFLAFDSMADRNLVYTELNHCLPRLVSQDDPADVTQLWREGHVTNFEYLVYLNKAAGRSLNDLMQYPIFPFVLAEYSSKDLNLEDPQLYRNFRKPIAIQRADHEHHYVETYNYLKRNADAGGEVSKCGPPIGPFHYGSLYSNPGIVLHFLVRLPPFTQMFLAYQDRNFDIPDRTFHSLETAWRLSSSDSTSDVKELIPEFFYNPRFLVNECGFNFGVRQSGERVNDVILPPWSQEDPRLFVLLHRQALESHWVRDHLHHWIDLIFGYKQSGSAAVDAINVFHPATSSAFEANCNDPIECSARRTMIRTYGQLPRQLFRNPHPMSSQQLSAGSSSRSRSLFSHVEGIAWGSYVGSPSQQDPMLTWMESYPLAVSAFVVLQTGDTYALGPFTAALVGYSYENSVLGKPSGILGVGLILWGHPDGSVRLKLRKDQPTKPLIKPDNSSDPVVLCQAPADGKSLWVAFASGIIRVYTFSFDPTSPQFEFSGPPRTLVGHRGKVISLRINPEFGIAVSAGIDGVCILWDLYKYRYIRSFTSSNGSVLPVKLLALGTVLGEMAAVYEKSEQQSILELRTVNAKFIGSIETQYPVTAVCFSSAPEGVSVNVVAAGLSNGTIRLWNTWNLDHVRDIISETLTSPIICVAFSSDSQQLLASTPDGRVLVWELPVSKRVHKQPPFLNLTLH